MLFILMIVGLYLYGLFASTRLIELRSDLIYLMLLALTPLFHQIKLRVKRDGTGVLLAPERVPFQSGRMAWGMVLYFGAMLAFHLYQAHGDPFHVYRLTQVLVFVPPLVHLLLFWKKPSYLNDIAFAGASIFFLSEHVSLKYLQDIDALESIMNRNFTKTLLASLLCCALWALVDHLSRRSPEGSRQA